MPTSWAEWKSREMLEKWGGLSEDPIRRFVEQAIRETIEKCAQEAELSRISAGFRCPAKAGPADAIGYAVGSAAHARRLAASSGVSAGEQGPGMLGHEVADRVEAGFSFKCAICRETHDFGPNAIGSCPNWGKPGYPEP